MERWIDFDEWHPVYTQNDLKWGRKVDIPDDKIKWLEKVFSEFDEAQVYLRKLHDEAKKE